MVQNRGVASFARSGGKIKIRGAKVFAPNFSGRNHKFSDQKQVISKKKMSSPKSEGFFWPKSQIFRPKPGDLQKKKKAFAVFRRLLLAEIANFNVFSAQKQQLLPPKKIPWGARKKSGGKNENRGGALPPRWRRAWCKILTMKTLTEVNRT